MRYLSLFSGIEAASEAWLPLGWTCVGVSEIEQFPCTVLQQRHGSSPNLGDVTKITEDQIKALGRIDLVVFGSPCQDLSVAGKRKGFVHEDGSSTRSGLFFAAVRIVQWAREHCGCRFALWENVPGAFSSNAGADFAAVVGHLSGLEPAIPPKGWGSEGCAVGPEAMVEWATLDAQWFGVAQRRRRVFALADFGDWAGRPPILLESESLRGDSPPSREAGESAAGTLAARTAGGGFPGSDEAVSGYVQAVATTLDQRAGRSGANSFATSGGLVPVAGLQVPVVRGDERGDLVSDLRMVRDGADAGLQRPVLTCASNAEGAAGLPFLTCRNIAKTVNNQTPLLAFADQPVCVTGDITHALKAEGFDASEDGTGRGQPIIAFNCDAQPDEMRFDPAVATTLSCSQRSAVALSVALRGREGGATAELGDEVAGTLRASGGGGDKAHVLAPVALMENQRGELRLSDQTDALSCGGGKPGQGYAAALVHGFQSSQSGVRLCETHATLDANNGPRRHNGVVQGMQVRRLTPVECERLQGFRDNYTRALVRNKPAADGPRYKALGNSMAVPVMHWIGRQIDFAMLFDMSDAPTCEDLFQ